MLLQLEAWKASARAWMYAIVWSETRRVGVVAAWMEGKRLAMTVLTVLPSVCAHCGHLLSLLWQNQARTCKIFGDLSNHFVGTILFWSTVLTAHSLVWQCAYSLVWQHGQLFLPTKQISLCQAKVHQTPLHQITFGAIGPKLFDSSPSAFSKSAGDV